VLFSLSFLVVGENTSNGRRLPDRFERNTNNGVNAGSYKVDFDGSSLQSGVYFYSISTSGFTQTK
jgi:hypothetical protein